MTNKPAKPETIRIILDVVDGEMSRKVRMYLPKHPVTESTCKENGAQHYVAVGKKFYKRAPGTGDFGEADLAIRLQVVMNLGRKPFQKHTQTYENYASIHELHCNNGKFDYYSVEFELSQQSFYAGTTSFKAKELGSIDLSTAIGEAKEKFDPTRPDLYSGAEAFYMYKAAAAFTSNFLMTGKSIEMKPTIKNFLVANLEHTMMFKMGNQTNADMADSIYNFVSSYQKGVASQVVEELATKKKHYMRIKMRLPSNDKSLFMTPTMHILNKNPSGGFSQSSMHVYTTPGYEANYDRLVKLAENQQRPAPNVRSDILERFAAYQKAEIKPNPTAKMNPVYKYSFGTVVAAKVIFTGNTSMYTASGNTYELVTLEYPVFKPGGREIEAPSTSVDELTDEQKAMFADSGADVPKPVVTAGEEYDAFNLDSGIANLDADAGEE